MQTQILVPLDGSPLAEAVLPQAALLARATHSTLILLRVSAPPLLTEPLVGALPAPVYLHPTPQQDVELAQSYLEATARRLAGTVLHVQTAVQEGDPASAITAFAERTPDLLLIAMATHARSGVNRWIFGSVAETVLRCAPVPVLLVRPGHTAAADERHPRAYRTILVPVDGSLFAEQALDEAAALAAVTGASLVLVAAIPSRGDLSAVAAATIALWEAEEEEAELQRVQTYVQRTVERLANAGIPADARIISGPPAEAILQVAADEPADVIVMATHGRSGMERLWLGSVAAGVVQGATRPVLLVHRQPVTAPLPAGETVGPAH